MALVLVVDDSKTARAYCRAILSAAGHEVMEASDAEHALDRMADQPPDCIVLDLFMPGLSGIEMMEVLGGRAEMTPIVVVTASMEEADRARCLKLGARAFVQKPVSFEELTRAVQEALTAGGSVSAAPSR
ncbi:MAG TPA: response regulator [Anaeromyxobacteraceae bacterium]|nr:response regulator [Anaeromyxobacteraceae bacterium]